MVLTLCTEDFGGPAQKVTLIIKDSRITWEQSGFMTLFTMGRGKQYKQVGF